MYSSQTKSWHWPHPSESQWQSPHSWEPQWQWPHHSWWDWGYNWGPAAAAWGPADEVVELFREYQDWQPHKAQDEDANGKGTYPGPPGLGKAQGADARGKKGGAKGKAQDEDANGKGLYPGPHGQGKAQGADAKGKRKGKVELSPDEQRAKHKEHKKKRAEKRKNTERKTPFGTMSIEGLGTTGGARSSQRIADVWQNRT